MPPQGRPEDDGSSFANFDPGQIFIAREQQIDFFEIYLNRWKKHIFDAQIDNILVKRAPSPDNKIQSLVVLLYGRGGFGKSTLLRRYRNVFLKEIQQPQFSKILAGNIIDWEFAVEGKRSLFNLPQSQNVDASEYFRLLCGQLAIALDKTPTDFKEYQSIVRDIEKTRKKANDILDSMQKDDRYAWLRGLTVEAITAAVRTFVPGSSAVLDQPSVKLAANEAAKFSQEQIAQVHAKLHDKLGSTLGDFLEASLRLGLALGRDLYEFAKNFPLLIFFDTYEEIDEGDQLLRTIMGAAGLRVGWVIAGRDNLWAGSGHIERNLALEYGYKDVTLPDRSLAVDFNVGGVGAFTISDIRKYFAQVCEQVRFEPPLPQVSEEEAEHILKVTQGVPLAVKIAAALYVDTTNLEIVTEKVESKRKIVEQMVRRYLMHTHAEQSELAPLYSLALLRRADQPGAITVALGLTPEQAKTSYASELSRLHRRYSFVFTEKESPSLHQEVRYFLRLWLLEHRTQPEVVELNKRLLKAHQESLKNLENHKQYISLKERLEDDEWFRIYLDLTEQAFWLDPTDGVENALPLMLAASIYLRGANRDIVKIGKFFEVVMPQPYRKHWIWAAQSLIYKTSRDPLREEMHGLEELVKLVNERWPRFSPSLFSMDCQKELEAALWWRLGEAYQGKNDDASLKWYEKALTQLGKNSELREMAARQAWKISTKLLKEKNYSEMKTISARAVELCPTTSNYYNTLGLAYNFLEDYQQAIINYNRSIELDTTFGGSYNNRGIAYAHLKDYQQAIVDLNRAIELDATDGLYVYSRGQAYAELKDYQQAIVDFNRAMKLDTDHESLGQFEKGKALHSLRRYQEAISAFHKALIAYPGIQEYLIGLNKAYTALRFQGGLARLQIEPILKRAVDFQEVLDDFNRAIKLNPTNIEAYYNRGETYNLMGNPQKALADFEQAIALNKIFNLNKSFNKKDKHDINTKLFVTLSYLKRYEEAIIGFEQKLKQEVDDEVSMYNFAVAMARSRGIAEAQTSIHTAHTSLLKSAGSKEKRGSMLYGLGGLEALKGNIDQALDYLEEAMQTDEKALYWARLDGAWLDFHNNSRFQILISDRNNLVNVPPSN